VVVLLGAFKAFDRALPDLGSDNLEHHKGAWSQRPVAMFFTGCAVALVTMSVSMAITILVPLVAKGRVRREDTLPYVAGANITTLADTLAAAVLLGNADAVRVVLAEVIGVSVWTVLLLGLFYGPLRRALLTVTARVLDRPRRLALFLAVLFAVPLTLVIAF
jgi:Na+/phosphate symporter